MQKQFGSFHPVKGMNPSAVAPRQLGVRNWFGPWDINLYSLFIVFGFCFFFSPRVSFQLEPQGFPYSVIYFNNYGTPRLTVGLQEFTGERPHRTDKHASRRERPRSGPRRQVRTPISCSGGTNGPRRKDCVFNTFAGQLGPCRKQCLY